MPPLNFETDFPDLTCEATPLSALIHYGFLCRPAPIITIKAQTPEQDC